MCFSAFSLSSFIWATFKPSSLIASSSLWTASSSVLDPSLLFPTSSSTVGGSVSVGSSVFSSSAKQKATKKGTQKLSLPWKVWQKSHLKKLIPRRTRQRWCYSNNCTCSPELWRLMQINSVLHSDLNCCFQDSKPLFQSSTYQNNNLSF